MISPQASVNQREQQRGAGATDEARHDRKDEQPSRRANEQKKDSHDSIALDSVND
jgi:hypothetical protein